MMQLFNLPAASKPFTNRRDRVVVCGEKRSANRTSWTRSDQPESAVTVLERTIEENAADLVWKAASDLSPVFERIDRTTAANTRKVLKAFRDNRIGPHHFQGSTGYGHGDWGRESLDNVMAAVMGAEAALMRIHFFSGTHAIATALFAVLRPGDEMLAVCGHPYDTLEEVIGLRGTPGHGSLMEWGITYREQPMTPSGSIDWEALKTAIVPGKTKVAHIQRSCGYTLRPTLLISEIEKAIQIIRAQDPYVIITVDNCYGEFTEELEPCAVGADLCMGSLIKNAGGTIVPGGGYVAGKQKLIGAVAARLAAPGIGIDAGQVSGTTLRLMYQGLFLGPQTTGESLKGGRLVAEVLSREGFSVVPEPGMRPAFSMITAIHLGSREGMETFCKTIQKMSPIGSYIEPVPGVTAGYGDEVIFADGTFIDGSTAELSADGPMRPPYVVYCQGGTHWTHWAVCLESAVQALRDAKKLEDLPNQQIQTTHN
ncbi:hypothetical protein CEUSTIGMA_g10089.t1 [Chlamydomonas eustigma]|uniref:Uncharacterized protein n=1 Tax=Chlamydomonas eustigma TaxID=1157962 RepID=A0A250XHY8_9CHLO|nr:hypothetical protein CEUSTIGMA_g10089.t1 [Chlamydomonas eustigma]|eukprot:GAX82663.1 hypothetical protein CEUSTIGMA_g10089.t1 [Chlamydomonas eustigma]